MAMEKYGQATVSYHLRDWLISRQRYWGAPIPMTYCEKCGWQPVPEDQLPVKLPTDVDFRPTGESPIARSIEFQKGVVCAKCGGPAHREVDTMDTFVDSSWYFLRFADPQNKQKIFDRDKVDVWNPVDLYVGGEHATTHLIFSRFLVKVLYDAGLIGFDEPFTKLRMVGIITGEDTRKMSKRWGNVVNPDDVIAKFGADTMRMYEMFMGPFSEGKAWSTAGVEGVYRFLNRLHRLFKDTYQLKSTPGKAEAVVNKLVGQVTKDIENMSFNTAVAAMMEALNALSDLKADPEAGNWQAVWEKFLLVLAPFAPFLSEELYQTIKGDKKFVSVHSQSWPQFDPTISADSQVTIVVQVNGVVRERLTVNANYSTDEKHIQQQALASARVKKHINGATVRTIFIPGRVINFVTQ
jgi:leucyl-tRNA synthetase